MKGRGSEDTSCIFYYLYMEAGHSAAICMTNYNTQIASGMKLYKMDSCVFLFNQRLMNMGSVAELILQR